MRSADTLRALLVFALLTTTSHAQTDWPVKPVRIVVGFAPGSFTDVAARTLGLELTEQLGHAFVVENRGGAGGSIGADLVAKATADGYTFLLSDNSLSITPGLYPKLPYDPLKDLVQVTLVADSPSMLISRLQLPARSLKELVAHGQAKPGELTFGSGGQGSSAHLAAELLLSVAKVKGTHVPFKGVALSIAEVVAGRIDMSIASLASAAAPVRSGRAVGLAVSGKTRSTLVPDVPTFAEAGYAEYDMLYWWGIAAPTGTPAPILAKLHAEIIRASAKPKLQEIYAKAGARPVTSSAAEQTKRVVDEIKLWREVIARAGVKVE
jgi:tripartite-type tricarboxylate transporter receptor subunit TctC